MILKDNEGDTAWGLARRKGNDDMLDIFRRKVNVWLNVTTVLRTVGVWVGGERKN